jgi:hypothetical protein
LWSRGEGASRSTRSAPPFPTGHGFIEAVPQLARDLAGKLQVNAQAFDGSVDSLEYIDKAARRLGGQNCLDDPTILGPIIAYVGEAMREVTQGRWEIRSWDSHGGEDCDRWQPVVVAANGREYHPIGIFKELLERGSRLLRWLRAVAKQTRDASSRSRRSEGRFATAASGLRRRHLSQNRETDTIRPG